MGKKVYLSAAAHATDNPTKCPQKCGENIHCNAYMDIVQRRLLEHGFEVMRGDAALTGSKAMKTRVAEANEWGAWLYYVAHTNAGGGRYSMTICWPNAASKALAQVLHRHRQCVKSHKVVTRKDLYEIKQTAMPCLYDELFFHDNAEDCVWFHKDGMRLLAEETVAAICEMAGVAYKPEKKTEQPKPATPAAPTPAVPKVGDKVTLKKGKLFIAARGNAAVERSGTFYLYDGVKVGNRYRVTNSPKRVRKTPLWANVSGWIEL